MAVKDWIVGFDAREMWYYGFEGMNVREPRRTGYLRDDIVKPLTTDSSIWSSVFVEEPCRILTEAERKDRLDHGYGVIALPEGIGGNRPLWENVHQLESYLEKHGTELKKPYWIVAITGVTEDLRRKPCPQDWPRLERTMPASRETAWKLIGYDINTRYNECCLTGSSFEGDEQFVESLRTRWGPLLNEYHLFEDMEEARKFRDWLDIKSPKESPHCVYGIWLIRKVE